MTRELGWLFIACVWGCDNPRPQRSHAISPPSFPAISYFQQHCASCHGAYGSGYLPDMRQRLDDVALRDVIEEMTRGAAQAPLEGNALDALFEYHLTILEDRAFVSADRSTRRRLTGDVTPGATVKIATQAGVTAPTVEEHIWTATIESSDRKMEIHVTYNGRTSRFALP